VSKKFDSVVEAARQAEAGWTGHGLCIHEASMNLAARPRTSDVSPPGRGSARTPIDALDGTSSSLTRSEAGLSDPLQDDWVHGLAASAVDSASAPLPRHQRIQEAFGRFDISHVRTASGGRAADAVEALGADGLTLGDRVALGPSADLRTAAHEAAHVVQQAAGVHLSTGVGQDGDRYERHADAVADRVVRGESAEDLLASACGSPSGSGTQAVQMAKAWGSSKKDLESVTLSLLRTLRKRLDSTPGIREGHAIQVDDDELKHAVFDRTGRITENTREEDDKTGEDEDRIISESHTGDENKIEEEENKLDDNKIEDGELENKLDDNKIEVEGLNKLDDNKIEVEGLNKLDDNKLDDNKLDDNKLKDEDKISIELQEEKDQILIVDNKDLITPVKMKPCEEDVFPSGEPTLEDIQQYALGDCYLLAAAGALIQKNPKLISRLFKVKKDRVSVTVFDVGKQKWQTVQVTKDVPKVMREKNSERVEDDAYSRGALWVRLLEKALASLNPDKGYAGLGGGDGNIGFEMLTGSPGNTEYFEYQHEDPPSLEEARYKDTASDMFALIRKSLSKNMAVTASTAKSIPGKSDGFEVSGDPKVEGMVGGHVYTVLDAWADDEGRKWIKVRNPWGKYSRRYEEDDNKTIKRQIEPEGDGISTLELNDFFSMFEKIHYL
jgi:hypothetical protein